MAQALLVATLVASLTIVGSFTPCEAAAASGPGLVTLYYYTGWDPAYLHYSTQAGGWNEVPGRVLRESTNPSYPSPEWSQVTVEGVNVTFVFTNGKGGWDNNGGMNYHVATSGIYSLKDGQLSTVQSFGKPTFPRTFPSMFLNNWKDMMATWVGPRNNENQAAAIRSGGLTSLRSREIGWDAPVLSAEGLALDLGTGQPRLDDPTGFDGPSYVDETGEFHTPLQSYYFQDLPSGLTLDRTYITPPGQPFSLIRYTVTGVDALNLAANATLLAYVAGSPSTTGASAGGNCGHGPSGSVTCTAWAQPGGAMVVFGSLGAASGFTAAPSTGAESPVSQFQLRGYLDGASSSSQTAGSAVGITLSVSSASSWVGYAFVGAATSAGGAATLASLARSQSGSAWEAQSAAAYAKWLGSGVQPTLTGEAKDLYTNSLILLKNSQNPELGTLVASMHPAYLYKVWGRDGVFAAMILDAAGYHAEAALFLTWLSTAEMRTGGGFHTCYSVWTGEVVGFVEPQFDSAGAYPLAVLHHYLLTGDTSFLSTVQPRVRALEQFFLTHVEDGGFVPPDYSIWEESSSGVTGKPLPTSYYTFTQSMGYAGLLAAAMLEDRVWQEGTTATQLRSRAAMVEANVEAKVWQEDLGYYARNIWSTTLDVDRTHDSSTTAVVYSGLAKNATRVASHLAAINANLTQDTHGLARFTDDIFFYKSLFNPGGEEVGAPMPPWGVVTMFMAWAEMQQSAPTVPTVVQERLAWMVKHAAPYAMPVGEAIDGVTGLFVMTSCPDIYEYGGVYVWTVLMSQGLSWLPDPTAWPWKGVDGNSELA